MLTEEIAGAGCPVVEVRDGPLDLAAAEVVLMLGNANRYPVARRQLEGAARSERARLVIMHTEPLPPPRAAGLPRPRLHLREVAKILRRDPDTNDVYSNYFQLRGLARQGLPDLLVVTSLGRQEFLAERGIRAEWLPFGYHPFLGTDLGLPRDVEILFLPMARSVARLLELLGDGLARPTAEPPTG
jgi:hypothetical protein